jgi:hypothetical protein
MKSASFLIAFLLLAFSCTSRQEKFEAKMNLLQNDDNGGLNRYQTFIDSFRSANGKYPESLNEVYDYAESTSNYFYTIEEIEQNHFVDVFSKKGEWVGYFPLYDSTDTEIVSYVILSAGIDGKLDNKLASGEKLHMDDWSQRLKLYNPNEYDEIDADSLYPYTAYPVMNTLKYPPAYNAEDEKHGDKDMLLRVKHLYNIE